MTKRLTEKIKTIGGGVRDAFDKSSLKKFPAFKKKFRLRKSFRYPQRMGDIQSPDRVQDSLVRQNGRVCQPGLYESGRL